MKKAKEILYNLKLRPTVQRIAITEIAKNLQNLNVESIDVRLKGLGPGRRKITKILKDHNVSIKSLQDVTPLPFNGTRLRRKRRI